MGADEALVNYRRWWERHFAQTTELAGLTSESNELRYRPFLPGVIVRAGDDVPDDELVKAVKLGELTGTPVSFSFSRARAGMGPDVPVPGGRAAPMRRSRSKATSRSLPLWDGTGGRAHGCGCWAGWKTWWRRPPRRPP